MIDVTVPGSRVEVRDVQRRLHGHGWSLHPLARRSPDCADGYGPMVW